MYYRGAAAAIVVYDITRASSFKTLKHWVEELKTKGPKDIAIAIAGNKADLHQARVGTHGCRQITLYFSIHASPHMIYLPLLM